MRHTRITTFARCLALCLLAVALTAGVLRADWSYRDTFETDRAEADSVHHSTFWSVDITPLPEPYLFYMEAEGTRGLVFVNHEDRLAELCYSFPLGATLGLEAAEGIVEVDVSFPCNDYVSQFNAGRLFYSVSPDGSAWSEAQSLRDGHNYIPISAPQGVCYVRFTGERAMIDNLEVSLSWPSATLHVPSNYDTIQDAIDAARDGDVIEVSAGRYSGPGNRDIDFRGKRITVRSAAGPENTIIECGGTSTGQSHRGFYFHQGEGKDSLLSGFTIQGGQIFDSSVPSTSSSWSSSSSHPIGGGIYCEFSGPTIANCIITDCGAELGGGIGGVGADPLIVNCVIEQCAAGGFGAAESGGRGAGAGFIGDSDVTMTNCTIQDNEAYYNSFGAGLYFDDSVALVTGCTIANNGAPGDLQGGGAYCTGSAAAVVFKNCVFSENEADQGGGLFTESSSTWMRCEVTVSNCTIAHNAISGYASYSSAGGIYSTRTDILVTNSILWYNEGKPVIISSAAANTPVTYSNVEQGYNGTGNINANPRFASTSTPDYHLESNYGRYDAQRSRWTYDTSSSPCIDAGDPAESVGAEPFPHGGRINMGAYGGTQYASKGKERAVYHVAQGGRDWYNGLSASRPFETIEKAIDTAEDGDTVLVWPGVYNESLIIRGKAITIQSAADAAVITAPGDDGVSFYYAESSQSILANLIIAGCGQSAIFCSGSSPTLKNLTIVGNRFGVTAYDGAEPDIVNCILWGNAEGDVFCDEKDARYLSRYSCIEQGAIYAPAGNFRSDPLFVDPENGDYHLQSPYGRYDAVNEIWVADNVMSPCIDAGDTEEEPRRERMPNGNRINCGAYGGTAYASLSNWPRCEDIIGAALAASARDAVSQTLEESVSSNEQSRTPAGSAGGVAGR